MTRRIRRRSMERLKLYDLDKLTFVSSSKPPLPPPRNHQPNNLNFERYQFLCNETRNKTDPIYAATPMFRTIPNSSYVKHHRQILGSYIPSKMIKPNTTTSLKSPEPKTPEVDNNVEEEEQESNDEDEDRYEDDDDEDDDDDSDNGDQSSSSSSSDDNDDDDILDNDDNKKGTVQQIFDRNKKK